MNTPLPKVFGEAGIHFADELKCFSIKLIGGRKKSLMGYRTVGLFTVVERRKMIFFFENAAKMCEIFKTA